MLKILVIDDSFTVLQSVREALAGVGYGVCTCESARTATRMATQEPFDLIVTDIYMPDGDGLEVIRELRRVRPNIHFIAMSGMTGQRDMLKVAKYLGACQTLQKPFSADDLLAAVEATIGRSPPQAEEETSKQLKQGEDSC